MKTLTATQKLHYELEKRLTDQSNAQEEILELIDCDHNPIIKGWKVNNIGLMDKVRLKHNAEANYDLSINKEKREREVRI